jgi:hypothetical protein
MAHIQPEVIADLSNVLDEIRNIPGMKEKSFAVFYLKSKPFLHFHEKDGSRWADVKTKAGSWKKVIIPFGASAADKKIFLKSVVSLYTSQVK